MKNLFTRWAFLGSLVLLSVGAATPAAAQTAYGLVAYDGLGPGLGAPQALVTFDLAAPLTFLTSVPITGQGAGVSLTGLDVRPATGELYTLGHSVLTSQVQLYTLNRTTAALTAVGAPLSLNLGTNPNFIGFDFDPVADRIRVVGANRSNYRLDPNTGALAATDGPLAFTATDANAAAVPAIASVAHTPSVNGALPTLYAIDATYERLVTLNPPTSGTLNMVAYVQGAPVNPGSSSGVELDIAADPTTGTLRGYVTVARAVNPRQGASQLYTLNLTTGVATLVGPLGSPGTAGTYVFVSDIALPGATGALATAPAAELAGDWSLAPNPLADGAQLRIHLLRPARVEWTVTDALGRVVDQVDAGSLAAGPQALPWPRRHLRAGVYFFRLRVDGQPAGTRQGVLTE